MYPCADNVIDPTALSRIGRALLARVQAVYASYGVALPSRQLWNVGEPVYDCEQLVVSLMSLREGLIDTDARSVTVPSAPCDVTVIGVFQVVVVRCIPVPETRGTTLVTPTPEVIADSADVLSTDAYLLMKSGCKFDMFGADIVPPLHHSALGGMGVDVRVEIQEASGGFQAVVLNLETVIG